MNKILETTVHPPTVSQNLRIESRNILDLEITIKAELNSLMGTNKREFPYIAFHTADNY